MDLSLDTVTANLEKDLTQGKDVASTESNTIESKEIESKTTQTIMDQNASAEDRAAAQAVYELEKLGKFKLEGKEMTLDDLKKAMLRQNDYTSKTTKLSDERKAFESERTYYENLAADLEKVRKNPNLASEFVKTYPEKFHSYLMDLQKNTGDVSGGSVSSQSVGAQPQPNVELLSRLTKVEKSLQEQELVKAKAELTEITTSLESKYKLGAKAKPWVMGLAYEAYNENNGQRLTKEQWGEIYERVDNTIKEIVKEQYGELAKQQSSANAKARDVESGGGTPGRAPQKFKNFDEVTKFAIGDFKGF